MDQWVKITIFIKKNFCSTLNAHIVMKIITSFRTIVVFTLETWIIILQEASKIIYMEWKILCHSKRIVKRLYFVVYQLATHVTSKNCTFFIFKILEDILYIFFLGKVILGYLRKHQTSLLHYLL